MFNRFWFSRTTSANARKRSTRSAARRRRLLFEKFESRSMLATTLSMQNFDSLAIDNAPSAVTDPANQQIAGQLMIGPVGIQQTVAELTALQQAADQEPAGPEYGRPQLVFRRDHLAQSSPARAQADTLDSQAQGSSVQDAGMYTPQTVSTPNFTGATLADTGAFPPDSMGTVGPSQFIVAVNGRIRSFNKTTGVADGVVTSIRTCSSPR